MFETPAYSLWLLYVASQDSHAPTQDRYVIPQLHTPEHLGLRPVSKAQIPAEVFVVFHLYPRQPRVLRSHGFQVSHGLIVEQNLSSVPVQHELVMDDYAQQTLLCLLVSPR